MAIYGRRLHRHLHLPRSRLQDASVYPPSAREFAEVLSAGSYAGERLFRGVVRELFHEVFVIQGAGPPDR